MWNEMWQRLKEDPQASSRILRNFQIVLVVLTAGMILLPEPYNFYAMGIGFVLIVIGVGFDFLVIAPLARERIRQFDRELARLEGDPKAAELFRVRQRLGQSQQLLVVFGAVFGLLLLMVSLFPNRYTIALAIVVTIVEVLVVIIRQPKERQ
jgi:4-hydroxybenzoate polyprenyltransferase